MSEKKNKTEKKPKVGKGHLPPEYIGRPGPGRPKGKRNFKTDFEIAAKEIAKALRLGETPEPVYIELMKRGIKSGLKGNYNFWKDIAERIYGKEADKLEVDENIKVGEKEKEIINEMHLWLKKRLKKK